MANYVDLDGKKYVQLDDGSIVPAMAVLSVDGGFPVKLPDAQINTIRSITFPSNYPLPANQIADLKQVQITNFPTSFGVTGFPTSFSISNLPATYPLPDTQFQKLQTLSDTVGSWSKGSGVVDANTLRVTIATNQPTLTITPKRCTTGAISSVSASTTAVTLAAADAGRLFCSVFNDSTASLYLGIGFTPTLTSYSLRLDQNGYFEVPDLVAGLSIQGIWSATNGSAKVTRGN